MSKRINRRLFLGGAALFGTGIVLGYFGFDEQMNVVEESEAGVLTPTIAAIQVQEPTPTAVPPTFTPSVPKRAVIAIAAGFGHSLALTGSGEVVAWGKYSLNDVPLGLRDVVAVAAAGAHSLALTRSGEVVAWGAYRTLPLNFDGINDIIQISALGNNLLALRRDGTVVQGSFGDPTDVPLDIRASL